MERVKKRYGPKLGNGERFRRFIGEFTEFIYFVALGGGPRFVFEGGTGFSFAGKGQLPNVLYKFVRNALLHEGDLTDHVVFREGSQIGLDGERFIATPNMLLGIALAVIGAQENQSQQMTRGWIVSAAGVTLDVGKFWGRYNEICRSVGFQP